MGFTTDDMIAKYISLRDAKEKLAAELKVKLKPITEAMDTIANVLLDGMNKDGETTKKTDSGTAFIKTSEFVGIADWDTFMVFVDENNATNFLKKDVNKTAVQEYIKEHSVPPPGVNFTARREVQIRRPKA